MRLTCSLCKRYLLPISPLYTLTSEFIFSTLFSMHFLWLTRRVCLLIKSFLPSTVNWSFLRIFLVAKIYFNSVKTNNRPHSVAILNAISPHGDSTFFKIPGFFRKPWSPWVQDTDTWKTTLACLEIAGAFITHFIKVCFSFKAFRRIFFFLIIIS